MNRPWSLLASTNHDRPLLIGDSSAVLAGFLIQPNILQIHAKHTTKRLYYIDHVVLLAAAYCVF